MNTLITDRATLAVSPALHKRAMDALTSPKIRNPFNHLVLTPPPAGELPLLSEAMIRERVLAMSLPPARYGLSNRFKCQVIDCTTKRVVRETRWTPNLILDQGLNNWGSGTIFLATLATACAVGTGTTPVVRDSTGTAQITAAGTAVSADAPFFEAGDVGRLLKMDSGGEAYITVFTDTQNVTVGTSLGAVGPEDAAVWYVNQTGLATETKRSTTYLTGAGNCGTSDVSNVRTFKLTYDFSAEGAPINYTELGWSHTGSAGSNLNSRALISGGSVAVGAGQQLRVIYEWSVTTSQNASTAGTSTVTGWPVAPAVTQDGDMILSRPFVGFKSIDTSGNVGASSGNYEPGTTGGNIISLSTTATLPTFGNTYGGGSPANNTASTSNSNPAYVAGSFTRTKNGTWNLSTANRTDWRGVTRVGAASNEFGWVFVWDEGQTKANTHTLTIGMPCFWQRILTNP